MAPRSHLMKRKTLKYLKRMMQRRKRQKREMLAFCSKDVVMSAEGMSLNFVENVQHLTS